MADSAFASAEYNAPSLRSASSSDDENDAVNTEDARVYFGPLQSPEKKFAPPSGKAFRTPLRRSQRISAAPASDPSLEADDSDEEPSRLTTSDPAGLSGTSGEGTPLIDDMAPDEPSSVLASKVLSACDNPSPPPSPTPMQDELPNADAPIWPRIVDISFEEHLESPAPVDAGSEPVLDVQISDAKPADIPPPLMRGDDETDTCPHDPLTTSPEADLINFDSFSATAATPYAKPMFLPEFAGGMLTPSDARPATVDDLLSLSPAPSAPLPRLVIGDGSSNPVTSTISSSEVMTQSAVEEEQVLDFLTSDQLQLPSSSLPSMPESTLNPSTPIRRSSRPRRSRSPFQLPKVISALPTTPNDPLTADPSTARQHNAAKDTGLSIPDARPIIKRRKTLQSPSRSRSREPDPHSVPAIENAGVAGARADGVVDASTAPSQTAQLDEPMLDFVETAEEIRTRRRSEGGARTPRTQRTQRELGSLSPASADLLQNLVTKASEPSLHSLVQLEAQPETLPMVPGTEPPGSGFVSHSNEESAARPAETVPSERTPPPSPSKPVESTRTPARRIPVAEAIKQGTFSPQKPGLFNVAGPSKTLLGTNTDGVIPSPVFRRQKLDDPSRSPAKRVQLPRAVMTPSLSSPAKGKAATLPRLFPRAASIEIEHPVSSEPLPLAIKKSRSGSVEPALGKQNIGGGASVRQLQSIAPGSRPGSSNISESAGESIRNPLPFPIVAAPARVPPIPEVEEGQIDDKPARSTSPSRPVKASPAKTTSSLRQPSAGPSSRIPRIGAKPYARPKPAQTITTEAKPTGPLIARKALGAPKNSGTAVVDESKPRRVTIVRVASSSGSSSDEGVPPTTAHAPRTAASTARPARQVTVEKSSLSLKRKREGEKPTTSPANAQPVIVMRKVVPGIINRPTKAQTSSPARAAGVEEQASLAPSSMKSQGPIKMRRVADWKRPQEKSAVNEVKDDVSPDTGPTREQTVVEIATSSVREASPSPDPLAGTSHSSEPVPVRVESPRSSPVPEEASTDTGTRRSTRARRSANTAATTDVSAAPVRPLKLKPKPFLLPESSAFAGMSMVALKTLTANNTLKNQHQVAELQKEIIRKEGKRPDSPTSKVRGALERQKEEMAQQRQQRAARRARRSAGADDSDVFTEQESITDTGDFSIISVDDNGVPLHHQRGPGDEEDYVTPEKPAKRERSEDGAKREEKRVKWDRGLATTVWLDDSPPKPKRAPKDELTRKGCLATAAKSLRLDTLGNVLNANVPVPDLVQENIVVKKFVYEDDEDPDPPTPAPVSKTTRSKGKKSKT
ncbi:hypothetical protein OBBRIDRAFT_745235 [Obba rivulosa]|uniref:Uncharacterized protein n=1 Tax=Obba rivulosa TaxID=1052685 RepID=A0A8E2DTH2_9APHY|nr:hypothetical protein OBBRIDRAFT_745235 [Obba rivulosa]